MDVELTKESRKVLKSIYDIYCERRKRGEPKSSAVQFGEDVEIDDLSDAGQELCEAGFIEMNIMGGFELQDKAIIFMENFTKEKILKWVEFGANLIP